MYSAKPSPVLLVRGRQKIEVMMKEQFNINDVDAHYFLLLSNMQPQRPKRPWWLSNRTSREGNSSSQISDALLSEQNPNRLLNRLLNNHT